MKLISTLIILAVFSFTVVAQDAYSSRGPVDAAYVQVDAKLITPSNPFGIAYEETFDGDNTPTGLAARGWIFVNNDGGGTTTIFNPSASPPFPAYQGASYAAQNYQGANGFLIDQWLISPQFTVFPGDTVSFWWRSTGNQWDDSVYVKISNGGSNLSDFTLNLGRNKLPGAWTNYRYVFATGGAKRVALQYYHTDGGSSGTYSDYWGLDLFRIIEGPNVPVELTSFKSLVAGNTVSLSWTTATETNNKGFEVQRKSHNGNFEAIGFVNGKGTTLEVQNYSFVDQNVAVGTYSYRLKQVDFDGTFEYSKEISADVIAPGTFELNQNYPNPFNPSTNITFSLAVDSRVTLNVFNVLGQKVTSLVNGNLSAGVQTIKFDAAGLQSGVYFVKMEANGVDGSSFSAVKKMILSK